MPVVIGAKPESHFRDPIGLLVDCHRRIERFLSVLIRIGDEARGGPLTSEQQAALDTALRYFREAAPKHTADEEDSLFPRLRGIDAPEVKSALEKVDALESEHARMNTGHEEVDRLGQAWLAAGTLSSEDSARFSELMRELGELYRDHIAVEEQEVFPLAAKALQEPDRAVIGGEMAGRRGLR